MATSHADDHALTSPGFHPYLVCSTHEGLSGAEREEKVNEIFQGTPGVEASHIYSTNNLFLNTDETSCGVLRAFNDTIRRVFEANPGVEEDMTVTPLHPSMKMESYTVDELEKWFSGEHEESGSTVSISGGYGGMGPGRIEVRTMGLSMVLCPGVQEFGGEDVPDDEIMVSVRDFITAEGGAMVKDLSFYHHRVDGLDGETAVHTERMSKWSKAISQVDDWTRDDGSNPCLDTIIGDEMLLQINEQVLEVNSKISLLKGIQMASSLGLSEDDLNTCIWYMVYSLALNPMVCTLGPELGVKSLCEDGTSDLSKCPIDVEDPKDPDDPDKSSAGTESRPWRNIGPLMAFATSSLLGFSLA